MTIVQNIWHSFYTWGTGWGGLVGFIGLVLLILWYFTPAFLSSQAAKALLLNVGLGCLAFSLISGYYIKVGFNSCVNVVSAADKAAIERKNEAIKDLARCGIENWDITTGKCLAGPQ